MLRYLQTRPQCLIFNILLILAFSLVILGATIEKNWVIFAAFTLVSCAYLIDLLIGIWVGLFYGPLRPIYHSEPTQRRLDPKEFWVSAGIRMVLAVLWISLGIGVCVYNPRF